MIPQDIKGRLFPLYKELMMKTTEDNICTFCMQWGKEFSFEKNEGILFVGKAVNGWQCNERNVNLLFDPKAKENIFNLDDQITWIEKNNHEKYNTNKSAFLRVIKRVSCSLYGNDWVKKIAWTNLYKLAPYDGGNPSANLRKRQLEACLKIFQAEISILQPKTVIFFTSGWERKFLTFMNGSKDLGKPTNRVKWNKYYFDIFEIKGIRYIETYHPQGKNESEHVEKLVKYILRE